MLNRLTYAASCPASTTTPFAPLSTGVAPAAAPRECPRPADPGRGRVLLLPQRPAGLPPRVRRIRFPLLFPGPPQAPLPRPPRRPAPGAPRPARLAPDRVHAQAAQPDPPQRLLP